MSAAVLYMPFNEQAKQRVTSHLSLVEVQPIATQEINIEDLGKVIGGDVKLNLSVVFNRVRERFNANLDEESRLDVIPCKPFNSAGGVASIEDFKRAKETAKEDARIMAIFNALREFRKIRSDQGLVRFMEVGRSYGGVNGVDYDLAQEYAMTQRFFTEELKNIGIQHIRVG